MIAISSHRPHTDCPPEIVRNQIRAHQSWQAVFDEILYFGSPEPDLTCPGTEFVDAGEDFPTISTIAWSASFSGTGACLINADIVVSRHLKNALKEVEQRGGLAATSKRYEFIGENVESGQVVDHGIDFFWSQPELWRDVARNVPKHYRIGHSSWDTWVMSYFNTTLHKRFYDITRRRCIYHPKHGNRKRAYEIKSVDDKFTLNPGFPFQKL